MCSHQMQGFWLRFVPDIASTSAWAVENGEEWADLGFTGPKIWKVLQLPLNMMQTHKIRWLKW